MRGDEDGCGPRGPHRRRGGATQIRSGRAASEGLALPPDAPERRRWAVLAAPAVLLCGVLAWQVASAAGSPPLEDRSAWRGGTVVVAAAGAGTALLTVGGAAPGPEQQRCVAVRYDGDVAARVRLVVPDLAGELAEHLVWTVTEGTGGDPSCAGFTPLAAPAYAGTLAAFATAHGDGSGGWGTFDPTAAGQERVYRVAWSVADTDAAQGVGATFSLRWEARSA